MVIKYSVIKYFVSYKVIIFLLFIFSGKFLAAQDRIDSAMATLFEKYPQEKIYLAYDRSDYVAGETIWFKGFVFSGYTLSDISTNLYVELYNSNKEIVAKKTVPLFNGSSDGSLSIPDTTSEGIYYIRAYTNWMLNFNEAFQYVKPILVYNPNSKLKLQKAVKPWTASLFAEGGNLLNNIQTKITVRLNSGGDLQDKWQGYLIDSLHPSEKILSFQSLDQNVAQFSFVPSIGSEYQVIIEDNNGNSKTIPFPKVLDTGVNLSVEQRDSILAYKVDFLNRPAQETYKLVGTIDNNLVYKANIKNDAPSVVHSFSTSQMLKGVLRLTLFDKDYHIVSERLCFLYPELEPKIIFNSLGINNSPRANNGLSLVLDSGETVCAMVFDANAANPFEKNNLLSQVWLTSDFVNKIHHSEQYFINRNSSKALDAVLISNQWERFNWKDILSKKFPEIKYPKDNYNAYTGTVYYKNKPLQNEYFGLILFLPDSTKQMYQAKTDENGKILLDGLLFEGNAKLLFQQAHKKFNKEHLKTEFTPIKIKANYKSPFPETNYILTTKTVNESYSDQVVNSKVQERYVNRVTGDTSFSSKVHALKEVKVYSKTRTLTQQLDDKLSSGRYYNPRETVYDFVNVVQDGIEGTNLHLWLRLRIPGFDSKDELSGVITYYIDEFIVSKWNLSLLDALSISDVALVKMQGKGQSHQVFIYLKKGGELVSNRKSLSNEILSGYEHQEMYISPDYSKPEYSKIKTDTRDVLYWGANFFSDSSNQKFKFNFYNNDKAKRYRIVIIKVSNENGPIFYEKSYEALID